MEQRGEVESKPRLTRCSVGIPTRLLDEVDQRVEELVREGRVYNRSDFVREALEKMISKNVRPARV